MEFSKLRELEIRNAKVFSGTLNGHCRLEIWELNWQILLIESRAKAR